MNYIELDCKITPNSQTAVEIFIAELGLIEFDSFEETNNGLKAYIIDTKFDENNLKEVLNNISKDLCIIEYSYKSIKNKDWNEVWESNFPFSVINDQCLIRAPFHKDTPKFKYEIIIQPKMAFGTGQHETTILMIEQILNLDLNNKSVLDMGCGTGVLSILSSLKSAKSIIAIDNDEFAYKNTLDNIKINNICNVDVFMSDIELVNDKSFDIILANINKNTILKHLPSYSESLNHDGIIVLSGLLNFDAEEIKVAAMKNNLKFIDLIEKNNWVSLKFVKH
ncbi:MAG: 50S ribosomal protein L11 methyltransferase [Bacteroidetes bacterium]|nr:MAG: 50S ribosomal protein L11 methyltransferase [Bacteroidota bacterium]